MKELLDKTRQTVGDAKSDPEARKKLAAVLVVLGVMAALLYIAATPRVGPMRVLYNGGDMQKAYDVKQALKTQGVHYELQGNGSTILVPETQLGDLQLELVGKGIVPMVNDHEIYEKLTSGGIKTPKEQALTERLALQQMLASTLASLEHIESARVHISKPDPKLFDEDKEPVTASVTVVPYPGKKLTPNNVEAIARLVAGSVPGLEWRNVTVVDKEGRVLSTDEGDAMQMRKELEIAQEKRRKILALLGNRYGHAEVSVDVRTTRWEESITDVSYDSEGAAITSEETFEETETSTKPGLRGVAGAAGNRPGAAGAAGLENKDGAKTRSKSTSLVPKTEKHKVIRAGEIERMTVSVIVDGSYETSEGPDGEVIQTFKPLPQADLDTIRNLVKGAVGVDEQRGDVLVVESAPAAQVDEPEIPAGATAEQPIWERLAPLATHTTLTLLVVLVLGLFALRPLVKWLTQPPPQLEEESAALGSGGSSRGLGAGSGSGADGDDVQVARRMGPDLLDPVSLQRYAADNADRTAEIIRGWLQESIVDEEAAHAAAEDQAA